MQKQMQYTSANILVQPTQNPNDPGLFLSITPEEAGWDYIYFQARRLATGQSWSFQSGENELAIVNFTGVYTVTSNRGEWRGVGGRTNVFTGGAHALYLPRHTDFTITAEQGGDFAVTWVPTDEDHDPWLIKPEDVAISIRGGDNASRQINDLLPPGSPVHRLVLVEVYTPSGNWSSYPGHKHDVHLVDANGKLIEADLEEVYFYKIDRPEGCAYQRVYTDERSPLHRAGYPIDALVRATDNTAVLVPEGYHPVTSTPGYTTYYLNVLAGSAQSLANQDDPQASWVKTTYTTVDNRLPLYSYPSKNREKLIKKSFSSFTLDEALKKLQIDQVLLFDVDYDPLPPSTFFEERLRRLDGFDLRGSERAKELLIDAFCEEVIRRHEQLRIWKAAPLQSDELVGAVDYLIAPRKAYLDRPLLCVVEAKKDDFEQGMAQCALEMHACQWNNRQVGKAVDIYGIVSNGQGWQFYKLDASGRLFESTHYAISQPDTILGVLDYVFTQCEQNL